MVILPIDKKLKKRRDRTIALAQDILVMEVYNSFPKSVLHGGTAIWRCYGSNRFSEDVDFYFPLLSKRANLEFFLNDLKSKGFSLEKFKRTNNSIFSKFSYLGVIVSCEIVFKNVRNFVVKPFEMIDGTFILVNTLTPEQIINEKICSYLKRRKIRDLYDIFFLLKFVESKKAIENNLVKFLREFKPPKDENELKMLIISGAIPTVESMLEELRRWAR